MTSEKKATVELAWKINPEENERRRKSIESYFISTNGFPTNILKNYETISNK